MDLDGRDHIVRVGNTDIIVTWSVHSRGDLISIFIFVFSTDNPPPPSPAFDDDPISPIRYIETNVIKSDPPSNVGDDPKPGVGGSLKLTGQMGDVMKESASIAMTVGRKKLTDYMSNNEVRERKERKRDSFTASYLALSPDVLVNGICYDTRLNVPLLSSVRMHVAC